MESPQGQRASELILRVVEARSRDVGRGLARLHPADLELLNLAPGQLLEIIGRRRTVARAMPTRGIERGTKVIQIDGIVRENAGVGLDDSVTVRPIEGSLATRVTLRPLTEAEEPLPWEEMIKDMARHLDGIPAVVGDRVRVSLFGTSGQEYAVVATDPNGPVILQMTTDYLLVPAERSDPSPARSSRRLSYEDIGGLKREVGELRQVVEISLKHPEIVARVGIEAPRALLLSGPTGVGKSLIAQVVTENCQATFLSTSASEIIFASDRQSESVLENLFAQARARQPTVLFIDEMDLIASRHDLAAGSWEKRLTAELLALIDRLEPSDRVLVIGATTHAENLDPSLRRRGRFERVIHLGIPTYRDRIEILEIHSRGMPLAEDVDLQRIAELTPRFVGADLRALCQEAALSAMREILVERGGGERPSFERLAGLKMRMEHFLNALRTITPLSPDDATAELIEVGWDHVGGLDPLRRQLVEAVIHPLRFPTIYASLRARPVRGVLLYGPPGTGKTLLARALAGETGINFVSLGGSDILTHCASERIIRDLFHRAKQVSPSIVFLDDLDLLSPARQRGEMAGVAERAVADLLREMDRLEELRGVALLAAAHRLDDVPPELLRPGRFDLLLEVPLPDLTALQQIFAIHLRGRPLADDVDLAALAHLACGFTGADVEAVCQEAALLAIREHLAAGTIAFPSPPAITQRHLTVAIEQMCLRKLQER